MDKRKVYIIVSFLIVFLIGGLVVWAIFIGRAQKKLAEPVEDLGYLDPGSSSGGGVFGGFFGSDSFDTDAKVSGEPASLQAQLRQLYNLPGAGTVIITNTDEVLIRFVDRATGHVFEKNIGNDTTNRILQTTVPKVYEALFTEGGSGVIRRYLDENDEVVSVYDNLKEAAQQKSVALEHNIRHMTVAPKGDALFYLVETPQGVSGVVAKQNGEDAESIWQSGLLGWLPLWERDENITLVQKPSSNIPGSAYTIDTTSFAETPLLTQIKGLTVQPQPAGQFILYSRAVSGSPTLWVQDTQTLVTRSLAVATFADKCVWSVTSETEVICALPDAFPDGEYPDAWHQGRVHFSDSFWRINVEDGALTEILAPARTHRVLLDAVNLMLDDEEAHILFTNNTDKTICSISLVGED